MDPGNKGAHGDRTTWGEMLKRIDSLANQLSHNCTEIQDTAWQPGVPELAEQMGNTVSTLQSEINKLRDELTAMDGRHQKIILENDRLRQIVANTGGLVPMATPVQQSRVTENLSTPVSSQPVSSTAARVVANSTVAAAAASGGATGSTTSSNSNRLSAGGSTSLAAAGGNNNASNNNSSNTNNNSTASAVGTSNDLSPNMGNVCELCMASFKSRQTLLQHRHIHDPSPRFCCQLCGNKFRQQSGLYQHMRVVHRKQ